MGSSFLHAASKKVTDVRSFLRDSAGGNSIKYAAEKGAKHIIYIPYKTEHIVDEETGVEKQVKQICAIQGPVHEWTTQDGKFKAVMCLKGIVRQDEETGAMLNDGTCPFCDRITDAWDIYRYRRELEEANCKLQNEARKTYLEKTNRTFMDERKAKDPKNYMYILVVKYRLNENGQAVLGSDNLPEYDLKVMKLSSARVEKIQQQLTNSGSEMEGAELIFEYPNVDDRRLLVSQSTTAPVFPNNQFVVKYPNLLNKINQDIAKFDWDGISKAFTECEGMTSMEAKTTMDNMFEQWDKYKKELIVNPTAKYLEYVVSVPTSQPSISGEATQVNAGSIPIIPTIPNVGQGAGVNTGASAGVVAPEMPQAPQIDPNSQVFGGLNPPTLSV